MAMKRWIAILAIVTTFGIGTATAQANPAYAGGCAQAYKGTVHVWYHAWGGWWGYIRQHVGGWYGGWQQIPGSSGYFDGGMGPLYGENYTIEIQYAVGNPNGWSYGHVAWINPWSSGSTACG